MSSKTLASGVVRCLSIVVCLECAACGDKAADAKAAQEAIRQQIGTYTAAVETADESLGARVWRTTPDVSFIYPAGHGHGWEEVKGFYKFFGTNFSDRKFAARDIVVHVNGDTAWAEFYWHFKAKQVKDGSTAETDGRESQVYIKQDGRWQLVHVHFSSPVASQ
jgi:ketosteroid isomerase-like protein